VVGGDRRLQHTYRLGRSAAPRCTSGTKRARRTAAMAMATIVTEVRDQARGAQAPNVADTAPQRVIWD